MSQVNALQLSVYSKSGYISQCQIAGRFYKLTSDSASTFFFWKIAKRLIKLEMYETSGPHF